MFQPKPSSSSSQRLLTVLSLGVIYIVMQSCFFCYCAGSLEQYSLPQHIRDAGLWDIFKRQLKTDLFRCAF